jgi:diguanylate cyclase (GGDEF)-like protein/PAS domain S-box-containing protein
MYQAIAEQLSGVIFVLDMGGVICFVSSTAASVIGWQTTEMVDTPILDYFLSDDHQQAKRALRQLFKSQIPVKDFNVRMRTKNGGFIYARFSASLYHEDGGPMRIIGLIQNVSDQRQTEIILEKQNQTLRALHQVTLDIGTASEILTLLRRIMEKAVELLDANQGGSIFLHDDQQKLLLMVEGAGINEKFVGTFIHPGEGVAGRVFQSGQPLCVNDYRNWEDQYLLGETIIPNAVMGVPLLAGEKVIGVLTLFADSIGRIFTDQDVALAEMFAAQASVAYQNTQLYERTQRELNERKQAETREREQRSLAEALRDTASILNTSLDLEKVFDYILITVERVIPYDVMSIMMIEDGGARTVRNLGFDVQLNKFLADWEVPVEKVPFFLQMMETRTALTIADTAESYHWQTIPELAPVRAFVGAPIVVDDQVIGLLNLGLRTPIVYGAEEYANRLQAFANQAALSIRNARLYSQVQRLSIVDELTSLYNRRGLLEVGRREVSRLQRFKRPLSALFLDIDHFKKFNDQFSYAVGDAVLTRVADFLQNSIREVDIVGRYGGEEMVVLLPEISKTGAVEVAERLRRGIEALKITSEWGDLSVTVSIGVAELTPLPGQTLALGNLQRKRLMDLIELAGNVLKEAKLEGRNRVAVG